MSKPALISLFTNLSHSLELILLVLISRPCRPQAEFGTPLRSDNHFHRFDISFLRIKDFIDFFLRVIDFTDFIF